MPEVTVDRQGRVVIPLEERRRLGIPDGGTLVLVPTPEGVLLERRRAASVRIGDDGLPLIDVQDGGAFTAEETSSAIAAHRERR